MAKLLNKEPPELDTDDDTEPKADKTRPGKITLSSNMEIDEVSKLHKKMQKSATRGTNIKVDATSVEEIDTAVMQLLLSFVREISGNGNCVNWLSPSQALLDAAELVGFSAELGLVENHATS